MSFPMTYLQFHLVFTLPWLVGLGIAAWRAARAGRPIAGRADVGDRFARRVLYAHLAIAFVYTTPWDNYLVFREVWGYPPGRVLFTIGYVPIEEYAFFLIQTAGTGLALFALMRARAWRRSDAPLPSATIRWVGAGLLLMGGALGAAALSTLWGTYLGLITAWALPVIALQWGFGGDLLIRRWRLVATAIALPTVWLWIADRIAIELEIWWISAELTTGLLPLGLPIEEALFFLITNVLVVFGMTMALDEEAWARARGLWAQRRQAWRIALLGWGIAMVPAPLVPDAFPAIAYLSTGLLTLGVLGWALDRFGPRALVAFAVALAFGVAIEAIGTRTGVPFGAYVYEAPGPSVLGVPLLVPAGWWAFTMIALAVAPVRGRAWLAPLALVAWDLGLDPLMVDRGFWTFARQDWFGVPISNFLGWYLSGLVLAWALRRLLPGMREVRSRSLRGVYAVQAFLIGFGLVLFGLPLAGAVAAAAMAGFALVAWRAPRSEVATAP
jgi:putative membrane protein